MSSKTSRDNLRLTWHVRDNIVGLVNHMAVLRATIMIIRTEDEKYEDATVSMLLWLIKNLFCLSSNKYTWYF